MLRGLSQQSNDNLIFCPNLCSENSEKFLNELYVSFKDLFMALKDFQKIFKDFQKIFKLWYLNYVIMA